MLENSNFIKINSFCLFWFYLQVHRRTANFLPGGAVNHLPKKFSQVAQIFTKKSKRNEGHIRCSKIGLLMK